MPPPHFFSTKLASFNVLEETGFFCKKHNPRVYNIGIFWWINHRKFEYLGGSRWRSGEIDKNSLPIQWGTPWIRHDYHCSGCAAFSVGNRVDDPLQKLGSSSPVVACKNTATPLPEGGIDAGRGGLWLAGPGGSGSHTNTVVTLLHWKGVRGSPLKKLGKMEYLVHSGPLFLPNGCYWKGWMCTF